MSHSPFNGLDHDDYINGPHSIPDPPQRSDFNQRGGSEIDGNACTDLDGPERGARIHDSYWISDPPTRSAFNGGGGSRIGYKSGVDMDSS